MVVSDRHTPTTLPQRKNTVIHSIRWRIDPRVVLDILKKRKYLSSMGIRTPDLPAGSTVSMPATLRQFP